jgi:NTE family protein
MMKNKNFNSTTTFKELFLRTDINLITTATCINTKEINYYSYKTHPNMQILTAVRMSSCFPIYFIPINYENNIYVDGGCLDNYPINLFKDNLHETIGVFLKDIYVEKNLINNTEEFLLNLIQCLSKGMSNNSINGYEKYSIIVKLEKIKMFDLEIDNVTKEKIYNAGYICATEYFNSNSDLIYC